MYGGQKRASDPMKMDLQVMIKLTDVHAGRYAWVLGNESGSFGRIASSLNYGTISPAPGICILKKSD